MRREGFELTVGKPQVLTKLDRRQGPRAGRAGLARHPRGAPRHRHPAARRAARAGCSTWSTTARAGRARTGSSRARGLIGLRSQLLTETRGTAQLHHVLDGWEPWRGDIRTRQNGSLVADRRGPDRHLRPVEPAGTRHAFRRPWHRGLRGHDRRRERPPGRHGRQPHQGAQADQHALVARPRSWCGCTPPRGSRWSRPSSSSREDECAEVTPASVRLRKVRLSQLDRTRG